jgi:hypothetical protein
MRSRPAGLTEHDHLAGLDVADERCSEYLERARLGCKDPAALVLALGGRQAAEHEGTDPERVADADDPLLVHEHERVGAFDARQQLHACVNQIGRRLFRQERSQELGVAGPDEATMGTQQLFVEPSGVDQVAVVPERHRPRRAEAEGRLAVLPDGRAGRGVAAMRDGPIAAQRRHPPLLEHLRDVAEVLVDHHAAPVADRHTGRLLATVLQREQAERRERGGFLAR